MSGNIHGGAARLVNKSEAKPSILPHQERVNIEMFKAIETLGRKLGRVEEERDRLARRLALIESAATLDEKTGKFYLPVTVDRDDMPLEQAAPRWMVAASLMSSAIALFSLGVVLFHEPVPMLTQQQLAALNSISAKPSFARFEDKSWESATANAPPATASAQPPLPDDHQLAAEESAAAPVAEAPAPAPSATPPTLADAASKNTVEPAAGAPRTEPPPLPPSAVAEANPVDITAPVAPEVAQEIKPEVKHVETAEAKPAAKEPVKTAEEAPAKPAEKEIAAAPKKEEPPVLAKAEKENIAPEPPLVPEENKVVTATIAPDTSLPEKLAALEKQAFAGKPEAQHDLATLYASGKIIGQDYKRAAYWFAKAADGGVANADYNLGVLFQQGLGVRKDVNKALGWYEKAAKLGHPEAMYNLGIAYIEGVGTDRNVEKGVAYFKSAANAGVAQAAYNLGVLYESNFIGKIDLAKAAEWYQVAANAGHTDAQAAVARLKSQMAKSDDQSLTVADLVEPAAGEVGEGDASPANEGGKAMPPPAFRGDLLLKIQDQLIKKGLLPSPASGALDTPTVDAISAWQKTNGLTVDGKPTQAVLDTLIAGKK